jgi:hypothetical protein
VARGSEIGEHRLRDLFHSSFECWCGVLSPHQPKVEKPAEKVAMNPICDANPDHGAMKEEPMYGLNNEILQYGWFCHVPDCDGYGGPVLGMKAKKVTPVRDSGKQMSFLEGSNET